MNRSAIPIPTRRQALEQVRRSPGFMGICAECGCTEHNACLIRGIEMRPCSWANPEQTLCTNPDCIDKHRAREKNKQ